MAQIRPLEYYFMDEHCFDPAAGRMWFHVTLEWEEAGLVSRRFQSQVDDALTTLGHFLVAQMLAPVHHAVGVVDIVPELKVPQCIPETLRCKGRRPATERTKRTVLTCFGQCVQCG